MESAAVVTLRDVRSKKMAMLVNESMSIEFQLILLSCYLFIWLSQNECVLYRMR